MLKFTLSFCFGVLNDNIRNKGDFDIISTISKEDAIWSTLSNFGFAYRCESGKPHAFAWLPRQYVLPYSAQVTIWTNSFAHTTNSTSNYRFNFLLDGPPSDIQRVFAVLAGYSLNNSNSIDYFVNIIFLNFLNSSLPLTL